jgi:hypothetical protein
MFAIGEVYYRLTFPDKKMQYPIIESLVYLGKNLSDEDTTDTWYFQPASDFGRHGSALEGEGRPVICVGHLELGDVLDSELLRLAIAEATARRGDDK